MKQLAACLTILVALLATPGVVHAKELAALDLTRHSVGYASLLIFIIAYALVFSEEFTRIRKSAPVIVAGGLIWVLIGAVYVLNGRGPEAEAAAKHLFLDYGELMIFLLVAITYVNTLEERRVFLALKSKLVGIGLSYRQLFWLTGLLAFCLCSSLDNLTTALVMGTVVLAVGAKNPTFITLGCINVVVATNAGGVFSPFGDITTLMIWQKGKVQFWNFFLLLIPALVNFAVPAAIMQFALPRGKPEPVHEPIRLKRGAWGVIVLFIATIATAILFKTLVHLPPALGMMLGLGYLQFYSYHLTQKGRRRNDDDIVLDSFREIARVEWDTLLFFFGIIFAVGGLGVIGYLGLVSDSLYGGMGPTFANIAIGVLGAALDNIPLVFAVLTMNPEMSDGQWLLVTLTTGTGGSLVSIGSAAGVAVMGIARHHYTFLSHMRWAWAIALGYAAAVAVHLWINAGLM